MKFQAFLSHNSADKPAVEALAQNLEAQGITTFLDKWHLIPGDPWQPAVEKALSDATACVVFVGPSGLGPWQNEEMRAAITRRVTDFTSAFRVVPVLLPGAQREQRSSLPKFLVAATWVEFSNGTLDDDDAVHRLICGIQGRQPGPDIGHALFDGQRPYQGLNVFDIDDAKFFFGRDDQVDWMLERLARDFGSIHAENRFLSVIGASGSGKSSLVRAGLIPALQAGRSRSGKSLPGSVAWPIAILRPGSEPLKSLGDALRNCAEVKPLITDARGFAEKLEADRRGLRDTIGTALHGSSDERRFVLVVDQFEELFTQCLAESEAERRAFMDNLLYAASVRGGRTLVILTMRADFYGRCSHYEDLAHALSDEQELVPPLNERELRLAIEQPALLCGLEFETGLVDLLLQDMRKQPAGALPLLQQTLLMLWDRRDGRRLRVKAYRDIGEIEGALEKHADTVYTEHLNTEMQRETCRRILLQLTTPGEGTEDTRKRIPCTQLGDDEMIDEVLDKLTKGRLVTVSQTQPPQVEITHEALIRGWGELRAWLEADRESLRIMHQLLDAAGKWSEHDRDSSYLWSGARRLQAEEWGKANPDYLQHLALTKEFLQQSRDLELAQARQREQLEREARQAEERRLKSKPLRRNGLLRNNNPRHSGHEGYWPSYPLWGFLFSSVSFLRSFYALKPKNNPKPRNSSRYSHWTHSTCY